MSAGVADAVAFLTRLVRLDPAAAVRILPGPGASTLWSPLPWDVLVTRQVALTLPAGTPAATELLAALEAGAAGPGATGSAATGSAGAWPGGDREWRWLLPTGPGEAIEQVPAAEIRRVGAAAARTLREVEQGGIDGRAVGQRLLRDALLDHVPVTVEARGIRAGVPQRLVQAVLRMGFLAGDTEPVAVLVARPSWVGLAGGYGTAWWRRVSRLTVTPLR